MQISYDKDRVIYAGFFSRLAAFLLDSVLVAAALSVFKFVVWIIKLSIGDAIIFKPILFTYNVFDIIFYLLSVSYFVLMTYFCGATLGKFLMKIKVVDVEGQKLTFMSVLIRETVGRYLSVLIMYVGYIIAGLDTRKQGLHDKIADTLVIYNHPQPVKNPMPMPPRPMQPGEQPMPPVGQPGRQPGPAMSQLAGQPVESMQPNCQTMPPVPSTPTVAPVPSVQEPTEAQLLATPEGEANEQTIDNNHN